LLAIPDEFLFCLSFGSCFYLKAILPWVIQSTNHNVISMDIKDQIKQLVDGMALATSAISREIAGDKLATCNLLLTFSWNKTSLLHLIRVYKR